MVLEMAVELQEPESSYRVIFGDFLIKGNEI